MANEELIILLDDLRRKIPALPISPRKKNRIETSIGVQIKQALNVTIPADQEKTYAALVEKGKTLCASSKTSFLDIKAYIAWLEAAMGDFTGRTKRIGGYYRLFLLTAILFLILSPFFLGPILTLIFLPPIYLAMKGVKQRSRNGWAFSLSIVPIAAVTSIYWIRYAVISLGEPMQAFASFTAQTGIHNAYLTGILTIGLPIIACVLLLLSIGLFTCGLRLKKLFL